MKRFFESSSIFFLLIIMFMSSCNQPEQKKVDNTTAPQKGSYAYDISFLKKYLKHIIELRNNDGARVLVTGDYQARVMTSSADNDAGNSFGWINYDLIASQKFKPQFNAVGGEERFWIGPEGGQYSFYFKKGDSFNIKQWQVPAIIDTIAYKPLKEHSSSVTFSQEAIVNNYSGTPFKIEITRSIQLLDQPSLQNRLHAAVPAGVKWVAYETTNKVRNTGDSEWKKETGLLSVWLLGMFTPSDETVTIVPFKNIPDAKNYITDNYFGKIPEDRLRVSDSALLLRCDGRHRSKLGLSPVIAKPLAGSFDFKRNILTLILFTVNTEGSYVNSKWEMQKEPYKGDVVNAYNDGPLQDGSQLGPFYELESSSSALPLKPGETQQYKQVTCHFEGDYKGLEQLAQQLLGVKLESIKMK
ncbi:MAG: hypothetical protein IT249_05175 [Chitinophagaceae bacterium]|nr:hypothetical protein [Chitinophagaceae bacterium]